ncbi:fluoride efflux transporter CrcB [Knoellia koreensis]|uniref:Fluoride-specific ion channel FluC n=1 Tax=Knoellia koreensis TaxID=2730921 RepID=A0A849HBL8_9MICO|nr:fluoride efflux transporter CrcB [Knoellia sp. DB2414S]
MTALLIVLGAAVGAPTRYLADLWIQSRHETRYPWGTFAVNVIGSLVLGCIASAVYAGSSPEWLLTLVGTSFCGALTTFSTFSFEAVRLTQEGALATAVAYVAGSLAAGLLACTAGWALVAAVT